MESRSSRNNRSNKGSKKKFYKDVWFWLFIASTVLLIITLSTPVYEYSEEPKSEKKANRNHSDKNNYSYSDDTSSSNTDEENGTDSKETKFGESVEFKSGEKITVESAQDDNSIELQSAEDGEHPVTVKVTVQNTKSSPLDFNSQDFDLYDDNNEVATFDASTYLADIPDSIAAGKQASMTLNFASKGSGPYNVTFGNSIWK
ncbi:DUF4352 domain-containing protein [Companilactobacillus mishanensis]|uniref:DUF4352 domain-containing protein n=1 Tax=Companilactobacillus mishanensis TaxID=2486008 RepID=A0A5P0ZKW9_9LACO|nr:DUF4352 domain-containing protein [Companilactobacillus mishanensis]MQS53317.1 DUF4352 domain-containing protein [Companilactobacillus mishanensis]